MINLILKLFILAFIASKAWADPHNENPPIQSSSVIVIEEVLDSNDKGEILTYRGKVAFTVVPPEEALVLDKSYRFYSDDNYVDSEFESTVNIKGLGPNRLVHFEKVSGGKIVLNKKHKFRIKFLMRDGKVLAIDVPCLIGLGLKFGSK